MCIVVVMYLLLDPPYILSLPVYHHARLTIIPFVKSIWVIICTHYVLVRDKLYIIYKCSVLHALYALCMYVLLWTCITIIKLIYFKKYTCEHMWFRL